MSGRHTVLARRGVVLLEVLVSLVLLATVGLAAVAFARESTHMVERAAESDRRLLEAAHFLDAVALWPREELDQRLGDRAQGPWRLYIGRPLPELYSIALLDTLTGRELLRTALYREEGRR